MQPKGSLEVWDVKESDFPSKGTSEDKLVFLLNYAILAPSSHNSQPWKFNLSGNVIRLFADRSGWLQVADADQRELYIGLGCALENLLVAAEHFGYSYRVIYLPENEDSVASINLIPNGEPSPIRILQSSRRSSPGTPIACPTRAGQSLKAQSRRFRTAAPRRESAST